MYIGETSRTAFTRLAEHMGDYKAIASAKLPAQPNSLPPVVSGFHEKKKIKSCMWEHTGDFHGGVLGSEGGIKDYKAKVTGTFSKCLSCQVDEDIRMQECEAEEVVLLNSKHEYFTPKSVQAVFRLL